MNLTEKQRAHVLKTDHEPFEAIWEGRKNYETRKTDRDFRVGDVLVLREQKNGEYTGRVLFEEVRYKTEGGKYGLPDELCVLGLFKKFVTFAAWHNIVYNQLEKLEVVEPLPKVENHSTGYMGFPLETVEDGLIRIGFEYEVRSLSALPDLQKAADFILFTLDDWLLDGKYERVDKILRDADISKWSTVAMLSAASATRGPHCTSRPMFLERVIDEVTRRENKEAAQELFGNLK